MPVVVASAHDDLHVPRHASKDGANRLEPVNVAGRSNGKLRRSGFEARLGHVTLFLKHLQLADVLLLDRAA